MAGFFSLGGTSTNNNNNNNPPQDSNNEINPEPFYLYTPTSRNQEISHNYPYNKGTFDLWQNPPPPPHPHTHQQQRSQNPLFLQDLYSLAVGSSSRGGGSGGGGINIYDDHSRSMVEGGGGFEVMASTSNCGSGTISCQDCGNQAKKDCVHRRCRSCCKSRGYECPTHIKSTWVPAAKRRERQQQIVGVLQQDQQQQQQQQLITNNISSSRDNYPQQIPKRVKDHTSPFRLPSSNPSGLEMANLPAEVNTTAVFRCVRVSSIDNTEDQFAYQTAVSIGGHTFKGILYDQGPAEAHYGVAGDTSSGVSGNMTQQLNLTTATSSPGGATTTASQFLNNYQSAASHSYPFMAGTQFFHHQNPRS